MSSHSYPKTIKYRVIFILFILSAATFVFAEESNLASANRSYLKSQDIPATKPLAARPSPKEENLSEWQREARIYRSEGLALQRSGNLDGAMSFYQKAAEFDPAYAVIYNDLGVIYETKGFPERAEESYLRATKVDPNYLSAYANLALLYESRRDLDKAAFYWRKRVELGSPDDPWTQKAGQRLNDIAIVQGGRSFDFREQEIVGLTKDVLNQKVATKEDDKELAKIHFQKAKLSYEKEDEATALKEAVDAQLLDPSNREIEAFIEKVQHRLLSK